MSDYSGNGRDPNNMGSDFFYTGYDQESSSSFGSRDPFYRQHSYSDLDPESMAAIERMSRKGELDVFSQKRVAKMSDALPVIIAFALLGISALVAGLILFSKSIDDAVVTGDFFNNADTVQGNVIYIQMKSVSAEAGPEGKDIISAPEKLIAAVTPDIEEMRYHHSTSKKKYLVFDVSYSYAYNGEEYTSEKRLNSFDAGVLGISVLNHDLKEITVYVDRRDPSSSRIVRNIPVPNFAWLLLAAVGIVILILCAKIGVDTYNGKMEITIRGNNKVISWKPKEKKEWRVRY